MTITFKIFLLEELVIEISVNIFFLLISFPFFEEADTIEIPSELQFSLSY
jgi:hypothetical protein